MPPLSATARGVCPVSELSGCAFQHGTRSRPGPGRRPDVFLLRGRDQFMTKADTRGGILCIAAHPDDEVLGCGGVLALHAQSGEPVTIVIACEGESLRYGPDGVGQSSHIRRAAEKLGCTSVRQLHLPDQSLDTIRLTELIAP